VRVIILAGGRGTRLAEETDVTPKPMVDIGGKPMLWHIMNTYAQQGYRDFTIATGYLAEVIESWAATLNEKWNVKTLFTGLNTQTGGRIRQCILAEPDIRFLATYGDGLANVDLERLIQQHEYYDFTATLTAVRPPARFGVVEIENGHVSHFGEKLQADSGWINGGFFVLNREVAEYIHSDLEPFESGALPRLASLGKLGGYEHFGFWKPMDTLREKIEFQDLASIDPWPWIHYGT
jgi:glucose-1-phosphate cytidylyltransferase